MTIHERAPARNTRRSSSTPAPRPVALWLSAGVALAVLAGAAQAEGSRTLYPSGYGGSGAGRANLNLTTNAANVYLGVIPARTFIYVYAQAGERILAGSRNRTADGLGAIEVFDPPAGQTADDLGFGTRGNETVPGVADFTCSSGTDGLIATRAAELAGPNSADGSQTVADGYTPCVYVAPQTGVYGILFSGNSGGGATNASAASVASPALLSAAASAWDVTVRSSADSLTDIDGRVFTYAWAAQTGSNGDGFRTYSTLYYVTDDGYRYAQAQRGIDPNAAVFYANQSGFLDQGEPLYKDVRGNGHYLLTGVRPAGTGITVPGPQYPIFFSDVMTAPGVETVLNALGIPLAPPSPQVSAVSFAYPPTTGTTTYVGLGGTFSFEATDTLSYQIVISRDGVNFDPAEPTNRVLTGSTSPGTNTVTWDGLDNAGNPFPPGSGYEYEVTGRNGEVHFPFADVENNLSGGPTVTKLNGTSAGSSTVYYDDRGYVTRNGTAVGTLNGDICGQGYTNQPVPSFSLTGVDSNDANLGGSGNYYRAWSGTNNDGADCVSTTQFFGDSKALDLWTYESSDPAASGGSFSIIDVADVTVTVSAPASASPGATVSSVVSFSNVGSLTALDTTYAMQLPASLAGVACAGATCSYDAATGLVTISGLPGSLSSGQSASLTLSYTAPAGGSVSLQGSVGTSSDQGPNLAPDIASASTTIAAGGTTADVVAQVSAPSVASPGSTVNVPVTFRNLGPLQADGVSYSLTLSPGLAGVSCASAACVYDPASGVVTVSGLPASLAPNASTGLVLSYTAPGSGTVPVSATVATSTSESTTANNTASGQTTVSASATSDVTVTVAPPATAVAGSVVTVPVAFRNLGPLAAANVSYGLTLSAGLSGVSCSGGASCSYDSGTGVLTVTGGAPASLANGETFTFDVLYTAPPSGPVTIAAVAGTSTAESNAANNTAQSQTAIAAPDLVTTIGTVTSAPPGGTASVPVTVTNQGEATAEGVSYTVTLPTGLSGVSCTGATCSYDAATGVVAVAGLPGTLATGAAASFTLRYTAPAAGTPVSIVATAATTTAEPDTTNNAANAAVSAAAVAAIPVLGPFGMGALALLVGLFPALAARRRKA